MKKKYFTLIEVIITLSLTALIITMLFSYFVSVSKFESKVKIAQTDVYQKQQIQIRLNYIFSQLTPSIDEYFYSEMEKYDNLYFTFDNGIDPDPMFSGPVFSKLYVDKDKNLALITWPIEKSEIVEDFYRTEILFENVTNIDYKFLYDKSDDLKKIKQSSLSSKIAWYSAWPREKKTLPYTIFIKINDDLEFAFFLSTPTVNISNE